jgi:hypothetical protein
MTGIGVVRRFGDDRRNGARGFLPGLPFALWRSQSRRRLPTGRRRALAAGACCTVPSSLLVLISGPPA